MGREWATYRIPSLSSVEHIGLDIRRTARPLSLF
jgi:hypothetical protein